MAAGTAAEYADEWVARVRDDPRARLALLCQLYLVPAAVDQGYLPFRRAASAFMEWQLRRGLLNPESGPTPGSRWWRAVNEALLRDTCEASALAFGRAGDPRTAGVAATLDFIRQPTARSWYRAHNLTVASAYLANEDLARGENRVERFFLNLVLVRVLYAHALVANPRLALGWLAPCGRLLGDPRLGMTGIVVPRLRRLYDWSAHELGLPSLRALLAGQEPTPAYAWDPQDSDAWHPAPSRLARAAQRGVPATPSTSRLR